MELIRKTARFYKKNGLWNTIRYIDFRTVVALDHIMQKFLLFFMRKRKLRDIIVIESHNDFDCNGGAFYDYLIENKINLRYKIVWMLKNEKPSALPKNVTSCNTQRCSVRRNYYRICAKFLLCDDDYLGCLREGQISVYCTHGGCTFKNVKGLIKVPDSISYILSSSKEYDPYMCENYSIPYPNKRMLHFGFPSNDVFFHLKENEFHKINSKAFNKYILWMPTFRVGGGIGRHDSDSELPLGIPLFENDDQLKKLNQFLAQSNVMLVIKLHPMQTPETYRDLKNHSNIFVLNGRNVKELNVDNYRLMASADALVSDYSSSAYAYLLLDRPIGFVLSDIEHYKLGFSVENIFDYLPGKLIYTVNDFTDFISDVINGTDEFSQKRNEMLKWMYKYRDGKSSERLAKFLKLIP